MKSIKWPVTPKKNKVTSRLFMVVLLALLATGCSEEDQNKEPEPEIPSEEYLLAAVEFGDFSYRESLKDSFIYDVSGRQVGLHQEFPGYILPLTFEYIDKTIKLNNASGVLTYMVYSPNDSLTVFSDRALFVDSNVAKRINTTISGVDILIEKYYKVKPTNPQPGWEIDIPLVKNAIIKVDTTKGNILSIKSAYKPSGSTLQQYENIEYLEKKNPFKGLLTCQDYLNDGIDQFWYLFDLSENLPDKLFLVHPSVEIVQFQYEFDTKGNVVKATGQWGDDEPKTLFENLQYVKKD
jgi:hypothetical protein